MTPMSPLLGFTMTRREWPCALVVSDHADSAEMLATFLHQSGYRVATVDDAASALRVGRDVRPNAIVLDVGASSVAQLDLARALRDELGASTRLFALISYASRSFDRLARD